jgi:hypothetical protein
MCCRRAAHVAQAQRAMCCRRAAHVAQAQRAMCCRRAAHVAQAQRAMCCRRAAHVARGAAACAHRRHAQTKVMRPKNSIRDLRSLLQPWATSVPDLRAASRPAPNRRPPAAPRRKPPPRIVFAPLARSKQLRSPSRPRLHPAGNQSSTARTLKCKTPNHTTALCFQ